MPGGARLPVRTTIVRLSAGSLVVVSPPPLIAPGRLEALDSIGVVAQVVAPNSFHYVYAAEFMRRYPQARLLVAPGLLERVPTLAPADELGADAPPGWPGELEVSVLGPAGGISEVVLFHVSTGSLILTDLAFNMTRFDRLYDRLSWRAGGIPRGFGPARTSRLMLLKDRAAASRCLQQVAGWPIERIVVAHGDVVEHDAKAQFLKAFAAYLDDPA